jgi:hypothetical protein
MSMALSELDITSWKASIMIRVSHVPTAHQTYHGRRLAYERIRAINLQDTRAIGLPNPNAT